MLRWPLNLLTALSLLFCVAVTALWVRSYWSPSLIARHDFAERALRIEAWRGRLHLANDITGPARFVYPRVGPVGEFAGFGYGTATLGSWLIVPLWFLLMVSMASFLACVRLARHHPLSGFCSRCGYDLRATPNRCPECGAATGTAGLRVPGSPSARPAPTSA